MWNLIRNERGGALVTALFFILSLAVIATIIVFVTGSERRVAHNEYTALRAFNSSDAGAEVAINWLRTRDEAPDYDPNNDNKVVDQNGFTTLIDPNAYHPEDNKYQYDIGFDGMRFRPGWGTEWVDYQFTIDAQGESVKENTSMIEVQASRLFYDAGSNKGY